MSGRLDGKVCVISGVAGGQGSAAAVAFAREGALVVGCDLQSTAATVETVRSEGGTMIGIDNCSAGTPEGVEQLIGGAVTEFGTVHVLYNNAAKGVFEWFDDMTQESFWRAMRGELDPILLPCKAVWPLMKEHGNGSIINTASMGAYRVLELLPGLSHTTAKAAVIGFTRHLAFEGSKIGIRVNSISPGVVESQATAALLQDDEWRSAMQVRHMLPRLGLPADIAQAALYLASDESAWVTGANLTIDGGGSAL